MTTQQGSQHGQGSQKDNPGTGQRSGQQQPQHQQQHEESGQHGGTSGQQGGGNQPRQGESGNR